MFHLLLLHPQETNLESKILFHAFCIDWVNGLPFVLGSTLPCSEGYNLAIFIALHPMLCTPPPSASLASNWQCHFQWQAESPSDARPDWKVWYLQERSSLHRNKNKDLLFKLQILKKYDLTISRRLSSVQSSYYQQTFVYILTFLMIDIQCDQ